MNRFHTSENAKIYCIKSHKYRKFKNLKISYILNKTLVCSINCNNYVSKDEKIFKEESIEILKGLGLIITMKVIYCTK